MPLILHINHTTPLYFIFTFSVFIDILNGYLQQIVKVESPFPVLYKGLIILFLFKYLFIYKGFISLLIRYFVGMFCILFTYWMLINPAFNFTYEISYFLKIIYSYFILLYLITHRDKLTDITIINFALFYGVATAFFVVLGLILGFGMGSYGEESFGSKGLFIAANDIGLTMLIANCLASYAFLTTKNIKYLVCLITISLGCLFLGTVTGVGGTFLIWLFLLNSILILKFKDYKASHRLKLFAVVITALLIIPLINLYMYIATYDLYMLDKFSSLTELLFENKARVELTSTANSILAHYTVTDWLLGKGSLFFTLMGNIQGAYYLSFRAVEQDMYDIIGPYGVLLGSMLILFPLYIALKSVYTYFKTKNFLYYWTSLALIIYWAHSMYAGHALTSIQPSALIVVIIVIVLKPLKPHEE